MRNKKQKMNISKIARIIALALVLALCGYIAVQVYVTKNMTWEDIYAAAGLEVASPTVIDGDVSVTFLDVGQGDCTVIKAGSSVVMIDAGDRGSESAILSFLDANEIGTIDYLIATHPHADHIGSMQAVLTHCEVAQVLFTNHDETLTPTNSVYIDLLSYLVEHKISTRTVADNEIITLGRGMLTILSGGNFDDLNDCSIVMRYDYGETSFLLMGDAEAKVENFLLENQLDVRSDVLKAGHHGSKTGTTEDFIAAVDPAYVVASCGEDNRYGHPHREFMSVVSARGAQLLRTDTMGDIVFGSDGVSVWIVEQREAA